MCLEMSIRLFHKIIIIIYYLLYVDTQRAVFFFCLFLLSLKTNITAQLLKNNMIKISKIKRVI